MSTESLGTFQWAARESSIFARRFIAWLGGLLLFSLPAVVVVVAEAPHALGYLIASIVVLAASATNIEITNDEEEEVGEEAEEMSHRDMLALIVIVYSMMGFSISLVFLLGTALGLVVASVTGVGASALLIAVSIPLLDRGMANYTGYSIVGSASFLILSIFETVITMYHLSGSIVDEARRGRRRMLN
jgi:hypothetical protein